MISFFTTLMVQNYVFEELGICQSASSLDLTPSNCPRHETVNPSKPACPNVMKSNRKLYVSPETTTLSFSRTQKVCPWKQIQ
jgi:hypothetical protein